jgi:hypothetical protein
MSGAAASRGLSGELVIPLFTDRTSKATMREIICKLARGPQLLRCQRQAGRLHFAVPFVVVLLTREEPLISCNAPT